MIIYGLEVLNFSDIMPKEEPWVLHPWYTNYAAMLVHMERSARILCELMEKCSFHGYFPETKKRCHICRARKEEEAMGSKLQYKVLKGRYIRVHQYLGGILGRIGGAGRVGSDEDERVG